LQTLNGLLFEIYSGFCLQQDQSASVDDACNGYSNKRRCKHETCADTQVDLAIIKISPTTGIKIVGLKELGL
jgi:hypothetical protein